MTAGTPFALGTFASEDGRAFAGLVLDGRVADLRRHLGEHVTVRALVDDWAAAVPRLQALADDPATGRGGHDLDALDPRPPLQVGNVFQAAANFRQHVLDLMAGAEHRGDASDGLGAAERDRF